MDDEDRARDLEQEELNRAWARALAAKGEPVEPSPKDDPEAKDPSLDDREAEGSSDDSPWWVVLGSAMFLLGSLYALIYFVVTGGDCPVDAGQEGCLDEMGEGLAVVLVVVPLLGWVAFSRLFQFVRGLRDRKQKPK